jgi:hypothetical protein
MDGKQTVSSGDCSLNATPYEAAATAAALPIVEDKQEPKREHRR